MAKYRKKPIVIEAFKWTGGHGQTEDPEWIVEAIKKKEVHFRTQGTLRQMLFEQNSHIAHTGDYIIKGEHGEMFVCSPDIFEASHDLVS